MSEVINLEEAKENLVKTIKESPYKYYRVTVRQPVTKEFVYTVKVPAEHNFNPYTADFEPYDAETLPKGWEMVHTDPEADWGDIEIEDSEEITKESWERDGW